MKEYVFEGTACFEVHDAEVRGHIAKLRGLYPDAKFYGDYETFGKSVSENKAKMVEVLDDVMAKFVIYIEQKSDLENSIGVKR